MAAAIFKHFCVKTQGDRNVRGSTQAFQVDCNHKFRILTDWQACEHIVVDFCHVFEISLCHEFINLIKSIH